MIIGQMCLCSLCPHMQSIEYNKQLTINHLLKTMKKYNIINNTLGWLIFAVATFTYMATIEPSASYWDCPEFIAQAFKSEVGHPPGNPIFILAGRFAANFAGGDVMAVAKCVNAMSALLSAGTILLLFWTITHLVKRLVVKDGDDDNISLSQYLVVMGSGVCGALAYAWSDTFWFSAVEAEVYAFSSFCTALVVWLMLKWENRADEPGSDRWLVLIAYVFGFSLGVHLLNLLCIPALALIFYYRKFKNTNVEGSLITLAISCVAIVLILWGLEPGLVELGGYFDIFFVNTLGLPFNSGVIFYAVLTLAVFSWCIYELYKGDSDARMRWSFFLSIVVSGIPFIGNSMIIPVVVVAALGVYLFKFMKQVPVRIFSNVILSIAMIFIGFSCYALIIIRSNANTPLDENSPNTMFALSSYLSRDQYGKNPLLYGQVYTAQSPQFLSDEATGSASTHMKKLNAQYARQVKASEGERDKYRKTGYNVDIVYPGEMCMLFPRIWSSSHADYYNNFFDVANHPFNTTAATVIVDKNGDADTRFQQAIQVLPRPSFLNNLQFFLGYQLDYMYFRYFMWNFAGRQNDIQGLNGQAGDVTRGNWITGFSFIDNARLGDQELLPKDYSTGNKGHNVFYCLPLLLGIIGLLWQAFAGKRGIEQFWVVFFLFFMTGIAIVLYLNQPPLQPRERDYAYAGSFYAFAIWIGMGVAGLWRAGMWLVTRGKATKKEDSDTEQLDRQVVAGTPSMAFATVAALIGLAVPLQMVSQTWDDHDRSGRYAAHDFGMNYLSSLDKNAIIFTNGDNDTFPLWYLQEVEGFRTDVRVVNLSYLATDWYIAQMQRASYNSAPLPMQATATTFAYGDRQGNVVGDDDTKMPMSKALAALYSDDSNVSSDGRINGKLPYSNLFIPVNVDEAVRAGVISAANCDRAQDAIDVNLAVGHEREGGVQLSSSEVMVHDLINSSITQGWKRPTYFAVTVDSRLYLPYSPYLQNTGMAYQVTPVISQAYGANPVSNTEKMYNNVVNKFKWGGLDKAEPGSIYLDETNRRMVTTTRSMLTNLAGDLATEADTLAMGKGNEAAVKDKAAKALKILDLMQAKLPEKACSYSFILFREQYLGNKMAMAMIYEQLSKSTGDASLHKRAIALLEQEIEFYAPYVTFVRSLPSGLSACEMDVRTAEYFFPQLMMYYQQLNPQGFDALVKKVASWGVNAAEVKAGIERIQAVQGQMQQAQLQSKIEAQESAAPQDSTSPDGQEGGDPRETEAAMMALQGLTGGRGSQDDESKQ